MVKCLPTMWDTRVWSLGREDPLEKEMAPHSSTLAWKIPWMEDPGRLQFMGSQRVGHDWATSLTQASGINMLKMLFPRHHSQEFGPHPVGVDAQICRFSTSAGSPDAGGSRLKKLVTLLTCIIPSSLLSYINHNQVFSHSPWQFNLRLYFSWPSSPAIFFSD